MYIVLAVAANDAVVEVDALPAKLAAVSVFVLGFHVNALESIDNSPWATFLVNVGYNVAAVAVSSVILTAEADAAEPLRLLTVNVFVVALNVNVELSTLTAIFPVVPSANIK